MRTTIFCIGFSISLLLLLGAGTNPNVQKDFIKMNDSLYACRYEVTNRQYKEFLNALLANKKTDLYAKCIFDSSQWVKKFPQGFKAAYEMYHWHPGYDGYPIINITREAANYYCEWLTKKYNDSSKKKFKKVMFRIPTVMEWKELANVLPGHNLPWMGSLPVSGTDGKDFQANVKVNDLSQGYLSYTFDGFLMTSKVGSFKPNNLGIYDVIGNVSELTSEGEIKGGNWDNFIGECTIEKSQKYELPDPRVGFRVVMEVIEQ